MNALSRVPYWPVLLISSVCAAQSPFNGTWRPDPQREAPDAKPDEYQLVAGIYDCKSCVPPYRVKADGHDQPIVGNPHYDTLSVRVVDTRTLLKTAKKQGQTVFESRVIVSSDGNSLMEQQRLFGMGPAPVGLTTKATRTGGVKPASGSLISGAWRRVETDLTNHDEDTVLNIVDGTLTMNDKMGRSFKAKLDGSDAPYNGSPEFTTVSVKLTDSRTLEESDKKDGRVVKICTWTVDPDGTTMHARFDDLRGRAQEQTGHKLR